MLPDLEMRNFWYGTGVTIFVYVFIIIINLSLTKKKSTMLGVPSLFVVEKLSPLAKKYKILKPLASKYFWAVVELVFFSLLQYLPQTYFNRGFADVVNTEANFFGFVYLCPIVMIVAFCLFWTDPLKNMDLFTISIPVTLIFGKIGCFCAGCCNSVWWPGGMYNYSTRREELPIQLIESACALFIFVFLLVYIKKAKNRKTGDLYPIFTILYSGLRFISEFWRGQKLVLGPFRYYHLFCAIGLVLGIIGLIIVYKYSDKITLYFDNTMYFSRKLKQKQSKKESLKS